MRFDSLPPGVKIAAEWGGKRSPETRLFELRKQNRAAKLQKPTVSGAVIVVDALATTANDLLRLHPLKRAPITNMWREYGAGLGLSTPAIVGRVNVEVYPTAGPRRMTRGSSAGSVIIQRCAGRDRSFASNLSPFILDYGHILSHNVCMDEYEYDDEESFSELDPYEPDPWFDEQIGEWAEHMINAHIAEESSVGLHVTTWETFERAA